MLNLLGNLDKQNNLAFLEQFIQPLLARLELTKKLHKKPTRH